ncbi:MAG TPA: hypothetical protein VL285_14545 [Bryobacteraceae bacterium]|nr:hypothetical protein [Bryobacteraceae bacterium]
MRNHAILTGLLAVSGVLPAQTLSNSNATSIQGKRVKSPLVCGDGFVLTWIGANNRFDCLAGGGVGSSPAGSDKQIQFNSSGAFGASAGFTFNIAARELSLGPSGAESVLRLPSLDTSRWSLKGTSAVLNGVRDNLLRLGWNIDQEDAAEPQFLIQMETKYFDSTAPASTSSELHLGAYTAADGTGRRPIQINVFRANNADNTHLANDIQLVFTGNLSVKSSDGTVSQFEILDKGPVLIHSQFLASDVNGLSWLRQKRATGSTYSNLAYLDSGNRWLLSPDADPVIAGAKFNVGSVSNTSDFELSVDPAARSVQIGSGSVNDQGLKIIGGATAGASVTLGDGTNNYTVARNAGTSKLSFTGTQTGFTGYSFDSTVTATNFSGPAAGLTGIPASQLTGAIPDAQLSSNIPRLDAASIFTGGLQTITSDAVNAKIKLNHTVNGNGYGSQILFSGGGADRFFIGTARTAGNYFYGLQNAAGSYAYSVKDSTLNLVVGGGSDSGAAKLQVTGGVQYADGTRPACDEAHRGLTWYVAGGAGVKDTFALCGKDAGDVYAWQGIY